MSTVTQVPSIGRIVHYVARGSADGHYPKVCRAAIITQVNSSVNGSETISLCVLNPEGMFFNTIVFYHDEKEMEPGTWHWPEKI